MGAPKPGDWLTSHEERDMTLDQYKQRIPIRPTKTRNIIYIQPIGNFTAYEVLLIQTTAHYLEAFFGLHTVVRKNWDNKRVPEENRRYFHKTGILNADSTAVIGYINDTGKVQFNTQYILHELLYPDLPGDAACMIALCNKDLYPDETFNFVFGQAALKKRVGVWSFYRFGDASKEYKPVLLRTLKTASHETGHMFSLSHCKKYYCIMNGSNHLDEADGKPTWLCPDCLEKFCWNFNIEPKNYFERVREFWKKNDMKEIVEGYDRFIKAIE